VTYGQPSETNPTFGATGKGAEEVGAAETGVCGIGIVVRRTIAMTVATTAAKRAMGKWAGTLGHGDRP
jgi:hypothetical protein